MGRSGERRPVGVLAGRLVGAIGRQVAAGSALGFYVDGERLQLGPDGSVGLGDGTGYLPKAELRAGGVGVLSLPPGQVVQTSRVPSTARPRRRRSVGPGALSYDTTLRPLDLVERHRLDRRLGAPV